MIQKSETKILLIQFKRHHNINLVIANIDNLDTKPFSKLQKKGKAGQKWSA